MSLRLYDTAARAVRDFTPLRAGRASVYVCGLTVQGPPHVGHVRAALAFDVLRRWLTRSGLEVTYVRNVTDIDDKILNKAAEHGVPWWAWAFENERSCTRAYDALGVLPPTYEPRATGHVTDMVTLMHRLIERGRERGLGLRPPRAQLRRRGDQLDRRVADVPAGRGQHRVGEGVRDDVAVGVAGAAVDPGPLQPGDPARAAGLDRVHVGADADTR